MFTWEGECTNRATVLVGKSDFEVVYIIFNGFQDKTGKGGGRVVGGKVVLWDVDGGESESGLGTDL
jgi:hypothetical protein